MQKLKDQETKRKELEEISKLELAQVQEREPLHFKYQQRL
jgi:hypothetical protein